jgi:hypothetical protein
MCHLNMGDKEASKHDADQAISLDSSYVKGYYRKAVALIALEEYTTAKYTLLMGLELKAGDKDLETQLAKVEKAIKDGAKSKPSSSKPAAPASTSVPSKATPAPARRESESKVSESKVSSESKTAAETKSSSESKESKSQEDEDLANINMRGYKTTSDGRTTSYFNTELDEQAKQLIGDIAPKKIEKAVEFTTAEGAAAWNAAGTFEEKNQTSWATDRLKELFTSIRCKVPEKDAVFAISSVESVSGDASIVSARGKRKHVCDFTFNMKWTLKVEGDSVCDGTITMMDITTDKEYEFTNITTNKTTGQSVLDSADCDVLVKSYVKGSPSREKRGLQAALVQAFDVFVNEFRSK